MSIMGFVIVILIFIVGIGLVNEKWIHLQSDISLVLFSLIVSLALLLIDMAVPGESLSEPLHQIASFEFEAYLLDTVLCFMLFAGASKVNLGKFRQNLKAISLLALLTTVLSSLLYGVLFWGGRQDCSMCRWIYGCAFCWAA